ncbi:DUF1501 domain-containing protein [Planctomicrobium piriforme]|uniref:Tat (Twin-arginine translocation) pathway signal sequence n=1 Tax=Planctomicrobium piriforme TaxID=1576369 RepID=A0A1I3KY56_9PLAN|nr:DUF1501 domain-containing protein [Planctomicrobium piriforme]SFI77324.1 Protein of unknown function [Planctomicrobium piriforme]
MLHHRGLGALFGPLARRDVFRVCAGAGVSFLLPALDLKAAGARGAERQKSLITLWLGGGASQLESWDPHANGRHVGKTAPAIKTSVPDLEISSFLPRMAEQMHRVSVVRSLVSKEGDHERATYYAQTGYRPDGTVVHPALSALAAKYLTSPNLEIPAHVALAGSAGFTVPRGGYLGAQFDAFRVPGPGENLHNMRARVGDDRQQRRLDGLNVLSQSFRQGRPQQAAGTLHEHVVGEALAMMTSDQLKAFSLDEETSATKARYGDDRFGRGCLMARRLVEQGVRAVQVTLEGFDTHTNNLEGQQKQFAIVDAAFSALLEDLAERDLLESTLVLCMSEFGRTPWMNPLEGRDHWPVGFSCVLGGGGVPAGRVLGETDPDAAYTEQDKRPTDRKPPADPIPLPDLYATILTLLGLDPTLEIQTPIGRPIRLSEGTPVASLLS